MVELLDSKEEEETKRRWMTRSWLKKREELGYFTNIVRELQLKDTEGFKEMPFLIVSFVCSTVSPLCETIL